MKNLNRSMINKLIKLSKQDLCSEFKLNKSDIDEIIYESHNQQVYGLVSRNILKIHPDLKEIEDNLLMESVVYVYKEREIKELAAMLNKAGIQYTLIKGLSYSYQVYKVKGARQFNDTDILVDSSDVRKAHKLLLDAGGVVIEDTLSCKSVEERMIYQSHLNTYRWKDIVVEIHQTNNNFIDMQKVIQNRHLTNGVYITDLVDTFIIACMHLWHHFTYSISSLRFNNQLKLRLLLDVYESYRAVESQSINDTVIFERAKHINAWETVFFAVPMAEEIYGVFFNQRDILCGEKFNYPDKYEDLNISLIDRIFDPKDVYKEVLNLYLKNPNEIINIPSRNDKYFDIGECFKDSFLHSPLYFTTVPWREDFNCRINIQWSMQSLFLQMEIQSDNSQNFSNTREYQMNFNHLEVSVLTDDGINTVYIEAKKDCNTFLYTRKSKAENPEQADQNGAIEIINDYTVHYSMEIPWSVLSIEPNKNKEIKIEITYIENQYEIGKKFIYALFGGECSDQGSTDFWAILKLT